MFPKLLIFSEFSFYFYLKTFNFPKRKILKSKFITDMNLLIDKQYQLLKKIGNGSFSSIYLGKQLENGHDVAIKLVYSFLNFI